MVTAKYVPGGLGDQVFDKLILDKSADT